MRLMEVDVEVEGTVVEVEAKVVLAIDAGISCYTDTMKELS